MLLLWSCYMAKLYRRQWFRRILLIVTMVLTENLLLTSSWCGNMNAVHLAIRITNFSNMYTVVALPIWSGPGEHAHADKSSLMKLHLAHKMMEEKRDANELNIPWYGMKIRKIYDYIYCTRLWFMNKPHAYSVVRIVKGKMAGFFFDSLSQSDSLVMFAAWAPNRVQL